MNKFFKAVKTFFNKLTGKSKSTSKLDAISNFELEKFIGKNLADGEVELDLNNKDTKKKKKQKTKKS